jgi:hypothetical protein
MSVVTGIARASHDAAVFLLSIQDIDPLEQTLSSVAWALRPTSRIVILMTHPAFRIPRHSGWGVDPGRKLVYRRLDGYLSAMDIPMRSVGGEPPTWSFHRPLSSYVNALARVGFAVDAMLEIPDLPPHERPSAARRSTMANPDIPLFLCMRAVRGQTTGRQTRGHESRPGSPRHGEAGQRPDTMHRSWQIAW